MGAGGEWGLFQHIVGLCLHYFWAEPAQFSDSKLEPPQQIYVWVWFAVWVLIFLTNDIWQVAQWMQCCLPAQNYGISHHSMNKAPDQWGSKCNPRILFKSLFYSWFYYFKKITKFQAQIVCSGMKGAIGCINCVHTGHCYRQSFFILVVVFFFFFVSVNLMILHPIRAQCRKKIN